MLEESNPEFHKVDSPTCTVGFLSDSNFKKVSHTVPMLSLFNVFSEEDLNKWFNGNLSSDYVVEPKLDGLSIELIYSKGYLSKAITRGNGYIGEDITINILRVPSIPKQISYSKNIVIRGEIFLEKDSLNNLNCLRQEENKTPYKNCRNAAAGIARSTDFPVGLQYLKFFAYWLYPRINDTYLCDMEFLQSIGIPINSTITSISETKNDLINFVNRIYQDKYNFKYDIDGVVIKINKYSYWDRLGVTSHHPRFSVAFKQRLESDTVETKVVNIETSVGRTGVLTPVAELEPVMVGGATVSRATLHNQDMLDAKNVNIGDRVIIRRAGDVIPEVVKVTQKNSDGSFQLPSNCPECGAIVEKIKDEVAVRCSNALCPAKLTESIKHMVSRDALNIDGLGDKVVEQLVVTKLVKEPHNIFELHPIHLLPLERMGERSANKLVEAIQKSRNTSLHRFIYCLGIPMIGKENAKVLSENFGSIAGLKEALRSDLVKIEGIGNEMATAIVAYFNDENNISRVNNLLKYISFEQAKQINVTSDLLKGKVFVVTGDHPTPREELKLLIQQNGGKAVGSISGKVNVLLAGSGAGPKKLSKAKDLGIPTWSEQDLRAIID